MPTFSLSSVLGTGSIGAVLNVLREVDVRPIRAAAEKPFDLVFASRDRAISDHLIGLLYRGPRAHERPHDRVTRSISLGDRDAEATALRASAVVVVTRESDSNTEELALAHRLQAAKVPFLIAFADAVAGAIRQQWLPAGIAPLLQTSAPGTPPPTAIDDTFATRSLIKGLRALRFTDELALARFLPAFRDPVCHSLIEDTATANAAYSLTTGLVEINPIATIPMNVADMFVLTKNQALMSYKITLAMGMEADFRQIMPQIAGVIGGGFLFRQVARGLIGLVPGLGIIPKVGIAFAGTYAAGEAILRWCATGQETTAAVSRQLYSGALERGRKVATELFKRRQRAAEPASQPAPEPRRRLRRASSETPPPVETTPKD
ncbi:MAG: hypothetical protein ABIQ99_13765 [Thermoflexales bacterium]